MVVLHPGPPGHSTCDPSGGGGGEETGVEGEWAGRDV
jgi:hypothetical protein